MAGSKKQRVVAYIRVSTDAQAEHGFGLEVQEQEIRKWAKREGKIVARVLADEGVSGSNGLDTRDALPDALSMLQEGSATGLVVARLDRLARDMVLQETLIREIQRLGCEVFSTAGGEDLFLADDPDDPSRRLIRQILGSIAEYDRSMIALRLRRGRRKKAAVGGYAYGSPPYGWESVDGDLVEVEHEQAVLMRMRALQKSGLSIRQIAEVLNADGVRAKREGSRWHPTTVARALARV